MDKLVCEKSPNLFFLSWIEDQGALGNKIMCLMPYSENRHNFRKFTKERDRMLENRFDHAKIKLSTFIYAGPLGPTLFPSLVSINTWQTNTPIWNGRGGINWQSKVISIHHQAYRDHQQHNLYNDDLSKGQGEKEKGRRSTTVLVKIVQPLLSLLIRFNVSIKCSTCRQLYIEMKYNPSNMSSTIQVSRFNPFLLERRLHCLNV